MAAQPSSNRRVRVFFAGNSGRGKSFLCNILMQRAQFASLSAANRVTAAAQSECLEPAPPLVHTTAALTSIVDAPGMLEAGDSNLEANQAEIVKALRMPGDLLVVYVIGSNALRPLHEDLMTARTLRQFLLSHGVNPKMLEGCEMAVYNNYDSEEVEDTPAFVSEVVQLIRAGIGAPQLRAGLVPNLKRAKAEQYQPSTTLGGRVMLRTLLNSGVPASIDAAKIKTDAELRTDIQMLERAKASEEKRRSEEAVKAELERAEAVRKTEEARVQLAITTERIRAQREAANLPPLGRFRIRCRMHGMVLRPMSIKWYPHTATGMFNQRGSDDEVFEVQENCSIIHVVSGKALDVDIAYCSDFGSVILYPYHGEPNQRWGYDRSSGMLQSMEERRRVLDVYAARRNEGTLLIAYPFHGEANQQFDFIPA